MFGKTLSTPHTSTTNTTFIAADCEIVGTLTINGNARIDGKIEGKIICSGDLSIGASAYLNADIEAKTVSVSGQIHGNVKTSDFLELSSSAKLFGDIYTRQLKIDQGAVFVGTSHQVHEENISNKAYLSEKSAEGSVGEENDAKDNAKNPKKDKKK